MNYILLTFAWNCHKIRRPKPRTLHRNIVQTENMFFLIIIASKLCVIMC